MTSNNDTEPFAALGTTDESTSVDDATLAALFDTPPPDPADAAAMWETLAATDFNVSNHPEEVVSADAYCERCPHLADPPTVGCTHPGTEILGFPSIDQIRVKGCPFAIEGRAPTRSTRHDEADPEGDDQSGP